MLRRAAACSIAVALSCSGRARAQPAAAVAPAPQSPYLTPSQPPPAVPPPPPHPVVPLAGRVALETFGGLGLGAIGFVSGVIGGAEAYEPSSSYCRPPPPKPVPVTCGQRPDGEVLIGVSAGLTPFVIPLGVWVMGNFGGGNGGVGWAMLGEFAVLVPEALGFWGYVAARSSSTPGCCDSAETVVWASALILAPIAGAIVGYELTNDYQSAPRGPQTALRVLPSVDVRSGGGTIGLVGAF